MEPVGAGEFFPPAGVLRFWKSKVVFARASFALSAELLPAPVVVFCAAVGSFPF